MYTNCHKNCHSAKFIKHQIQNVPMITRPELYAMFHGLYKQERQRMENLGFVSVVIVVMKLEKEVWSR